MHAENHVSVKEGSNKDFAFDQLFIYDILYVVKVLHYLKR